MIYYYDGKEKAFDINGFIRDYQYSYYLPTVDSKPSHISYEKVSSGSDFVEQRIQSILNNGIRDANDVNLILAWKIGGIDHSESESKRTVVFNDGWKNGSEINVAPFFSCDRVVFNTLCYDIVSIAENYDTSLRDNKTRSALKDIIEKTKEVNGFGPAYVLTILYFVTRGQSPIFDRCAYTAVKSIFYEMHPTDIWYENPSCKGFNGIWRVKSEYEWLLERVFGQHDIGRDIDRALWVYGHKRLRKIEE